LIYNRQEDSEITHCDINKYDQKN